MSRMISVPFRFDGAGRLTTTVSQREQAEAQIWDVVMTHLFERVMRYDYGANLRGVLFEPLDPNVMADVARQVQMALDGTVRLAKAESVILAIVPTELAAVEVRIAYSLVPFGQSYVMSRILRGYINEETPV